MKTPRRLHLVVDVAVFLTFVGLLLWGTLGIYPKALLIVFVLFAATVLYSLMLSGKKADAVPGPERRKP